MPKLIRNILFLVTIGLCLIPLFKGLDAISFAGEHGCDLHEGFVNPCVVDGIDYGEQLYADFGAIFLSYLTVPLAGLLFLIFLVFLMRDLIAKGRQPR